MKVEERALLTTNQFYLSKEVGKKATEQGFHSLSALPDAPSKTKGVRATLEEYIHLCTLHNQVILDPNKIRDCKQRKCSWLRRVPKTCHYPYLRLKP